MKEALCRPDKTHWCIECCLPGCPLLGDTGEGKIGCLGHDGRTTSEGLTQRSICLGFGCLDEFLQEDRKVIRQIILRMPAGRFKMSEALLELNDSKSKKEET